MLIAVTVVVAIVFAVNTAGAAKLGDDIHQEKAEPEDFRSLCRPFAQGPMSWGAARGQGLACPPQRERSRRG